MRKMTRNEVRRQAYRQSLRRLATCHPHEGCGGFQSALRFLRQHGIEPAIRRDRDGDYFAFRLPRSWTLEQRRAFNREINEVTDCEAGEGCPICGNRMTPHFYKARCLACQAELLVCVECITFGQRRHGCQDPA
jgi:hypothetical protein